MALHGLLFSKKTLRDLLVLDDKEDFGCGCRLMCLSYFVIRPESLASCFTPLSSAINIGLLAHQATSLNKLGKYCDLDIHRYFSRCFSSYLLYNTRDQSEMET
jgi:hypothetical protein